MPLPAATWSYLVRSLSIGEAVEEVFDDSSRFTSRFFFQSLGYRVGLARARHLLLQSARMAVGWALILRGGKFAQPALLVEAAQLVSFSLTTLRTIAGLPRVPVGWREAFVLGFAAAGVATPRAALAIPALSIGLHVGKSVRGLLRATRAASEDGESWGEAAAEATEEAFDDITDAAASALGVGDWWDDERTTAEADQARWQQAGRLVSTAAAAAAAASTALQPVVLPGGTSTASAAAAVAGAFMFQRNLRLIIAENMLYIRLWLFGLLPALLRLSSWLLWRVVLPMRRVAMRGWELFAALRRTFTRAVHWLLTTLCPPLKKVKGLEEVFTPTAHPNDPPHSSTHHPSHSTGGQARAVAVETAGEGAHQVDLRRARVSRWAAAPQRGAGLLRLAPLSL